MIPPATGVEKRSISWIDGKNNLWNRIVLIIFVDCVFCQFDKEKLNNKDMADEKIIFSMNGVGKILPHNNRVILKDIYLSFFYGAKIGIVGLNGSGKSTLMKIIAGIETGYQGEVVWAPGYSVGYLEQEPQMDPDKTVIEVVQEGVQEIMDILKEYE